MSMPSPRRRLAVLAVAALAATGLTTTAPTAFGQPDAHAVDARTRVHRSDGRALGAADARPGTAVRDYLATQGLGRATADSLRTTARWTVNGVTYLRMRQYAGGLPVVGSEVKAALDSRGRPLSVIENASRVAAPAAPAAGRGRATARQTAG